MSSAIALNPLDFPLFGSRLIEASAGTGKTYTIAALYVRLILGHHRTPDSLLPELLPPDILVVTFTEAATQELRERIRARLSQAAQFFRQKTSASDDFLIGLRSTFDPSTWASCARRLELAANWMDEAAVYTIHSWCNRMLQQHAFDSGSLFQQEVNTDDQELLQEVVRDYWRTFFYLLSPTACLTVLNVVRTPEILAERLRPLLSEIEAKGLAQPEDLLTLLSAWERWEQRRQALEATAQHLWHSENTQLTELLRQASTQGWLNGAKYRKDSFAAKLAEISQWASLQLPIELEALAKFGQENLIAGLVKAHMQQAAVLQHPALQAIDALVAHASAEPQTEQTLILHALHWVRQRYSAEKQRRAQMSFDDMLTRLDHALQSTSGARLAEIIRQQYPMALIDEFQDTDPIQYRIFSTLYPAEASPGLGCLMIGDPKQAIYSFRGADIYTYLKAHQATAGRHYTLNKNFRSTQALVAAINQLFSYADQQSTGVFRFKTAKDNPLPFIPVSAQGREADWQLQQQSAHTLTLWHWDSPTAIGLPEYRQQMAEVTASEIVKLLQLAQHQQAGFQTGENFTALQPADIAILVRSGTEAKVMRAALAKRQLLSVYLSERDSIFATVEANDMLLWLKAMADPRNERKVRAALSSATLGWNYSDLHALTLAEPEWELHLERFLGYQSRWLQDGILPSLRQLLSDYGLHSTATNERSITNLLHLAELLQQASSHLEGEVALIRYLAEAIADQAHGQNDANILRLESDANLIKIITIHKSKGLEYPLVFLPFICSFREVSSRLHSYYRYHDAEQALCIDLSKTDSSRELSDAERLQEDLRLLYVALTRAQFACWLGIAPIKTGTSKNCQLQKSAIGALLGWEPGMDPANLRTLLHAIQGDCSSIQVCDLPASSSQGYQNSQASVLQAPPRTAKHKIKNNWWVASYSALQIADHEDAGGLPLELENSVEDKHRDESELQALPLAETVTGVHSLPRGPEAGVLIHALLEQCARQGFASIAANPEAQQQLIAQYCTAPNWIKQQEIVALALHNWLHMPLLPETTLSLAQLVSPHYQAEMEFLIGAEHVNLQILDDLVTQHTFNALPRPSLLPRQLHGLLKGYIDLVFEHAGQYFIVDYKFNSLGNQAAVYTTETLSNAMLLKRYDMQYSLYSLALHRLLQVRLGANYDYEQHLGGVIYLFLRGCDGPAAGRVFTKPPQILLESLDKLFTGAPL